MLESLKTRKLKCGMVIALLATLVAVAAQQMKLYPADDAAADPTFLAFRADLQKALERRDIKFIRGVISPDIELSSDGEQQGPEDFEQLWQPASAYSDLWDTLHELLTAGGSFQNEGRQFCAPYVYSKWPESLSAADGLAVTARDVKLHETCATNSRVLAVLDHDLVTWSGPHETIARGGKEWAQVRTADFTVGCLLADYVRSPLDYHVCFEKVQGKWMITALTESE